VDIFSYIASNDEYGAKAICNKYGYDTENVNTPEDMGVCLVQLTEAVGDPAWKDILALHPDKDVILDNFGSGSQVVDAAAPKKSGDCGCKGHKKMKDYLPSSGSQIKDGHIFIFAGALLLAAAIIAKN
jgi:hypothetical protein